MENAKGFLNGLDRLSSYAYKEGQQQDSNSHLQSAAQRPRISNLFCSPMRDSSVQQSQHSPLPQDLTPDDDIPLDAFDKELLAQGSPERSEQPVNSHSRVSLPPRFATTPGGRNATTQIIRDDLHNGLAHKNASSTCYVHIMSSPTISARQNRQVYHSSGSPRNMIHELSQIQQPKKNTAKSGQPAAVSPSQTCATRTRLRDPPSIIQGVTIVPTTVLPDRYRSVFPYETFNPVQSRCFETAFGTSENLVLSAPTGSGKTVVMELAICHLMATNNDSDFKVVYQAPTKSLCSERFRDWAGKFASLDLECAELTGDTEHTHLRSVQSASIIITTPEKWDSVTRKWKDNARLMKMIKLFLIDEVHILKEARGATLEAVVSRMKSVGSGVRFVALSATLPNSDDIATWLGRSSDAEHEPAHREVFGEEFRPAKLQKHVWGFRGPSNDFAFDKSLNGKVQEAIARYSKKKPTMIFCQTRKSAVETSAILANQWYTCERSNRLWPAPLSEIRVLDQELISLMPPSPLKKQKLTLDSETTPAGVAFHHGGLDVRDRRAVEKGFLNGDINIICCTSTLAVGINLPCYLVIIKGTVTWTDRGAQEYPDLEIMQMLGRAGRPQFEVSACAVIITRPEKVKHYERMMSGQEVLESCLHLNLVDHLNAEIGLGTVGDMPSAKKWLAGTFLYVRLRKNPGHYRLKEEFQLHVETDLLAQICSRNVKLLQDVGLVTSEGWLRCTQFGDAMARYFVRYETMKVVLAMAPKAKISEIISALAQASEFRDIKIKSGEKGLYKVMNQDPGVKFPIKVDITAQTHKVSLLIQTELGGTMFPTEDNYRKHKSQYLIDKAMVFSHMHRLIRCFIDCQLQLQDSVSVRHALELARSLSARVWDNSSYQLKQLDQIGDVGVRKLASAGINSIETLQNTESYRVEQVLSKNPPFGQKILTKAAEFPSLRVSVKQMANELKPGLWVEIKFKADIGFLNEKTPLMFRKKPVYVCFLAETSGGKLIDFRRFSAKNLEHGQEILLSVRLSRPTSCINCHVMCEEIAGTCRYAELRLEEFPVTCFPENALAENETKGIDEDRAVTLQATNREILEDRDEFGDLEDADLLGVEHEENGIEVIHDIDELLREDRNTSRKKSFRRTSGNQSIERAAADAPFKEPTKMANGKWTCQHPCKEESKNCNHKCCHEGVKRPAKSGRRKLAKEEDAPKNSEVSSGQVSKLLNTPFKKACSATEARKIGLMKQGTQAARSLEVLHVATDTRIAHNTAATKAPAHAYAKGSKPELSFLQNPYGLSVKLPRSNNFELHNSSPPRQPQIAAIDPWNGRDRAMDDLFDVEMDEVELGPDIVDSAQEADHRNEHIELASRDSSGDHSVSSDFLHCGVDSGESDNPLKYVVPTATQKIPKETLIPVWHKKLLSDSGNKGIPITGQSSGSVYEKKSEAGAKSSEQRKDDNSYDDVDAFLTEMEAADYDLVCPPAKRRKTAQSPSVPLAPPQSNVRSTTQDFVAEDCSSTPVKEVAETERQRQKRLEEEEQKKKWEEIDKDLYEKFKDYVELI